MCNCRLGEEKVPELLGKRFTVHPQGFIRKTSRFGESPKKKE
jgi:hypothetical protein